MTDQTVPVPVELLKELKASYRGSSRSVGAAWDDVETTLEGTAYDRVVAFIPGPPKIGDVLTAAQIKELPPKAVLRDRDGDLWVTTERGPVYLTVYSFTVDGGDAEAVSNPVDHAAVLVSLPSD